MAMISEMEWSQWHRTFFHTRTRRVEQSIICIAHNKKTEREREEKIGERKTSAWHILQCSAKSARLITILYIRAMELCFFYDSDVFFFWQCLGRYECIVAWYAKQAQLQTCLFYFPFCVCVCVCGCCSSVHFSFYFVQYFFFWFTFLPCLLRFCIGNVVRVYAIGTVDS